MKSNYTRGLVTEFSNWFNAGGGLVSEKLGAVSAGHLFEKICLWLVPLSGKTISIHGLPPTPHPSAETINVPSTVKYLAYNWKKLHNLEIGVLHQPLISNLESGDAFCVIEVGLALILIVLQPTIAEHHPVKANGLTDIVQAFSPDIRARIARKLIVFVTPVGGKLATSQPIHNQDGKVMAPTNIPLEARNFEQMVYRHFVQI